MNKVFSFGLCILFNSVSMSFVLCTDVTQLDEKTSVLMMNNSDTRMSLLPETNLSKYYTVAEPDPSVIMRSSCTSSYPTIGSYKAAVRLHEHLRENREQGDLEQEIIKQAQFVRNRLAEVLLKKTYQQPPHIVCMSSGTETEMIISLLALLRHPQWQKVFLQGNLPSKPLVCNIMVASGESGSGCSLAAGLRHFSDITALGASVKKGDYIDGIADNVIEVVDIPARDAQTGVAHEKSYVEAIIRQRIKRAIEHDGQIAVVHMMHSSKTGIGTPTEEFIRAIKQRYGNKVVLVVDMAQGRCGDGAVDHYLAMDSCVIVTGSKFFAGPSFSGIIVIPDQEAACLQTSLCHALPKGLRDYFSRYYVDQRLELKNILPSDLCIGMLLRFHAALFEMERFYAFEQQDRFEVAQKWRAGVQTLIKKYDVITMLGGQSLAHNLAEPHTLLGDGCNTIISFALSHSDGTAIRKLSADKLKKVYRLMALDSSHLLPAYVRDDERSIAQKKCLLGQPVKVADHFGVLRIALSAPMISDILQEVQETEITVDQAVSRALKQDEVIFEKLALVMKYLHHHYLQSS